jgi:hypothetical protein
MKRKMMAGQTSKTMKVWIQNASTGAGLGGLTNATSGLTCYYIRDGQSSSTVISLVAGTLGTWASGSFVAVDGTNMTGLYEFGVPNAVLAAGVDTAFVHLQGAANMVPCVLEIELDAVNYQSATGFVSSVPAVVGAVGSVTGAVGGSVASVVGNVGGSVASVTGNVGGSVASVTGNVGGSVASVTGNVGGSVASVTGNVGGITGVTFPTNFSAFAIDTNGNVKIVGPYKINVAGPVDFYLVKSSDHVTPQIGATVTAQRSINGALPMVPCTGTVAEIGNGIYRFSAAAADMNGTDISFLFTAASTDPVMIPVNTTP